ncbi:hypothetical protein K8I85_06100 [bacterium]|nr:hypothetical protein [bacterium]
MYLSRNPRDAGTLLAVTMTLLTTLLAAVPALSLERTAIRADRMTRDGWDAGASCTVTYANTCTGWLWVWSGWSPTEVFGVIFEPCCESGSLVSTQAYFWTGAPPGWGFTGTLAIQEVAADCPGTVIDSHPLLPPTGPVIDIWTAPPGPVALTYRTAPSVPFDGPVKIPTDHPAAGPTGPPACGLCYPTTRVTHTFRFGNAMSPLCPGERLNDGVCDAEALYWYGGFHCAVSVEESSWGALKNLYR